MDRETLILKWLNNDLNDQELNAFKALDDYDDLMKLQQNLQGFKAETYNTSEEYDALNKALQNKKAQRSKSSWVNPFFRVAAILALCFGLYYYTTTLDTTVTTAMAQRTSIELPDNSSVELNAGSVLAFNKSHWKKERDVKLQGEAFFKVSKGSTFKVITSNGTVTVYGTQFNVKQRNNYFEVICYEGLVGVTYDTLETKLKPGDRFLIIDGKMIAKEKELRSKPSWINHESTFESMPYSRVIAEFERQYAVSVKLENVDATQLFTGSFTHDDINLALKSITLPLNVTYNKSNDKITIKGD
ncbi:FecR family protein [Gaetbulibacter aestuarii]|uniref:FecR domain-containing protein n=1 Tax=Gaetbulibacter aestuarii TaxID=1502358 RepID=A0ABW7MWR3_9FLAO